jgi:regulatory protein
VQGAYSAALALLGARELSEHQLRQRLARKKYSADDIDDAVRRLKADGTLNDRRAAVATARLESAVKHRGRVRVLQKLRQLGIDGSIAEDAVAEVFAYVDERDALGRALDRRLRGKSSNELDEKGRARIVRALVGQGFSLEAILKALRDPDK